MGLYLSSKNGRPPTRQHLMTTLREVLQVTRMDQSKDSGHSFRIGAATTAAVMQKNGRFNHHRHLEDGTVSLICNNYITTY